MAKRTYISVFLPLRMEKELCYWTAEEVCAGMSVRVVLNGREYLGVADEIGVEPPLQPSKIKEVLGVERSLPMVSDEERALWRQIAEYYMCTTGEVYKSAYSKAKIKAGAIAERKRKKGATGTEGGSEMGGQTVGSGASEKGRAKMASHISSADTSVDVTDIQRLAEKIQLTEPQKKAEAECLSAFAHGKPALLNGVTGSGKTEIYCALALKALSDGGNVLYLVPEIALSRQLEERMREIFGDLLHVFHSAKSPAKKQTVINAVRSGQPYVVLGTRSSVFLPHHGLGLIIIDEEQDSSYKQDAPAPRYNGRDVALMVSELQHSNVILGSATPSLESLYNCMRGKYVEVSLTERYYRADAADVEIIDTSAERRKRGMKGSFSVKLIGLIRKCLDGGGQAMLLRTRRGYAPVLQCSQCGQILRCPHCNIPLTLHKDERKVRCHHCGYMADVALNCTECGGLMAALGAGTQKIEEETATLFPSARIARLDSDVAQDSRAEKDIVSKFAKGEIDILIGTQIVAKGFDFENLALVAVLQTDTLLGVRDFRADEKALQTLVQFRGRCGRRDKNGLIVIQTAQPNHPVYASLLAETNGPETRKSHNGNTHPDKTDEPNGGSPSKPTAETDIIKTLLDERKEFGYPPFTRLINIYIRHSNEARVEALAQSLAYELADFKPEGPALPPIDKEAGQHVRVLRLALPRDKSLTQSKRLILKKIRLFESAQSCPSAITIDVDPS